MTDRMTEGLTETGRYGGAPHLKISISRIELVIEVQEAFGSSVRVRISDLVESNALVFTVSDKEDDFVEYKFAVFTASIMNVNFLLL